MLSFGNGQTNGLPLLITTGLDALTAQLLHTAPAGAATPNVIRILASNIDQGVVAVPNLSIAAAAPVGHLVTVLIQDVGAATTRTIKQMIPVESGLFPILEEGREIILNGTCTVKVFADAASMIQVTAIVDDQSEVAGAVSQTIGSGLIAAVQAASRFGVNANGGVGQAAVANGSVAVARAGTLRNLGAKVDGAVGGGATITVSVFKNGVTTAQSLTLANADGTTWKQTAGAPITVAAGDLISFSIATDNAGAPAANVSAAVEFV
jgi:hypothetical protein